ncbi:MAG: GH3 auxin-responsive promoter family protein [Nostocales cyanobacterium 94392]|nr:GH3 auxin-responsive promoter family protein [Nostocales cyanobacterium 94392]
MVNFTQALLTNAAKLSKASFVRKTCKPTIVQEQFLLSLLHAYQETEFGKEYRFAEIKTVDQFRKRLPILPYSSYEPYLERIAKGEQNILTPDQVIYLNLTSGSTGKQKLIPVTRQSRKILNRNNQVSIGFAAEAAQKRGLSIGTILLTSSVQLYGRTSGGINYGPVSVGDLRLNSFLYQQVFALPYEALQPEDNLARHYVCLLFALKNPSLRIIAANFPVLALQLCQYLESQALELIEDLEQGTIAPWLNLKPELRAKLENKLSPSPKRAAQLRQILQDEGRLTPKSVWQNLSFITTARGGTSDFYLQKFPEYFGDTPIFGGVYSSAEGTFGIYHDFNHDGTILAIQTGFFEFIPEEEWDVSQPKTLLAHEVEVGKYYRILMSNYSGLYRYDIGDVVQVVGWYQKTPLITFRHRLGGVLSSTTEKTSEFHVTQVMQQLQKQFNLSLENFCITLSEDGIPPCYLVNIELASGNSLNNPQKFIIEFDRLLQEIHISYAAKRPTPIPSPRLRIMAAGSFATIRQRLLKRGIPASQLKFPHLSDDRQFLSGLTVEQEITLLEVNY